MTAAVPIPPSATVATFTEAGVGYELDHLGILREADRGKFAVYRASDGVQVAEFTVADGAWVLMLDNADLIALARQAVAEQA